MLFTADVRKEKLNDFAPKDWYNDDSNSIDLLPIVNTVRSEIPAVTHVDNSARLQTVNKNDNPDFYALIESFDRLTGCPVVVNTSFNIRGEPIVNTPSEAYICFMRMGMDALVIEDMLLIKEEQPELAEEFARRNDYGLD